jgi:hypothetical protein
VRRLQILVILPVVGKIVGFSVGNVHHAGVLTPEVFQGVGQAA